MEYTACILGSWDSAGNQMCILVLGDRLYKGRRIRSCSEVRDCVIKLLGCLLCGCTTCSLCCGCTTQ